MKTIKDVMTPTCQWISPEKTVAEAAKIMRDHNIGFVAVGENDRLTGTLTDRDITTRVVAASKDAAEVPVREAMTKRVLYCFDDQSVDDICKNMAAMGVKRLPVVNRAKRLVGVVSFPDLSHTASPAVYTAALRQLSAQAKKAANAA